MLKCMKAHWKRAVSGLLVVIMAAGMLPVSAFAADIGGSSNPCPITFWTPRSTMWSCLQVKSLSYV